MSEPGAENGQQEDPIHLMGERSTFRNILYVAALAFLATKVLSCESIETAMRCWSNHVCHYYAPALGIILLLIVIKEYTGIILRQEKQAKNTTIAREKAEKAPDGKDPTNPSTSPQVVKMPGTNQSPSAPPISPQLGRKLIYLDVGILCLCLLALQTLFHSLQTIPDEAMLAKLNQTSITMGASIESLTEATILTKGTFTNSVISSTEHDRLSIDSQTLATNVMTSLRLVASQYDLPDNEEPYRSSLFIGSLLAATFFLAVITRLFYTEYRLCAFTLERWPAIELAWANRRGVIIFDFLGLATCVFVMFFAYHNQLLAASWSICAGVGEIIFYYIFGKQ